MARSVRCLMSLNFGLFNRSSTRPIVVNQVRTLFTPSSLGMTGYLGLRDTYKSQLLNLEDSFRDKMRRYVEDDREGIIFTEDLKVMTHIVEKTPEDLDLLVKMVKKFNTQSGELRFGTFTFGPIVMRAFHRLNEAKLALEMFNESEFKHFFNQLTSYQVLMDLLYKNEMYVEMREVYDTIKTRLTDGRVHPRNALILVTAACYKEQSDDSYKYAMQLSHELDRRGYPAVRRVLTHLGALAINKKKPHVAIELLQTAKKPRYIGIRSLVVKAYADLDRVDNIIPFFRSSLDTDDPKLRKESYFKDTIESVEAAIERNKVSPDAEIVKLLKLIKSSDLVEKQTIDDHINTEIHVVPLYHLRGPHDNDSGTYDRPKFVRRPGLRDIL